MREGSSNGNWRGGICQVKTADEILELSGVMIQRLKEKLLKNIRKVKKNGCWEWQLSTFLASGYGRFCLGVNSTLAHRVAFILFYRKPIGKLCVLHTCDNKLCVNPNHLWIGTNADNSADMVAKGRSAPQHGSFNPCAKLDEKSVERIKKALSMGVKQNRLAGRFCVSTSTINLIALGKTWRHVG